QPKVPRDLETICLKCLAKDAGRRYSSAAALADDLNRFLDGKPIQARPISAPERAWRWCACNPRVALLSSAVVMLLLAVLAVSLFMNYRLNRSNDQLNETNDRLNQSNEALNEKTRIALEQSDLALEAIGEMIFEIQQELADTPGAREARLSILRKATSELSRLVNMPTTSDKYLRRHALAHLQLGRLAWQIGDQPRGHEEF